MKDEPTGRGSVEYLRQLMKGALQGSLKIDEFCAQFETVYNLLLNKSELTQHEASAFSKLFEQVVWYSPYPEERTRILNYKDDQDIMLAISDAEQILSNPTEEQHD